MQKRNLAFILTGILMLVLLANSASAYSNVFSIQDFLDSLDPTSVYILVIFLVLFVFINFALEKYFKGNKMAAGLTSLAIAFLTSYWMYQSGINLEGAFSGMGIQSNLIYALVPFLLLGALIFVGIKLGWPNAFFIFGIFFVVVGLTGFVAEATTTVVIGVALIIIAFIFYSGKKGHAEKPSKN